jgi:hypothetical protein
VTEPRNLTPGSLNPTFASPTETTEFSELHSESPFCLVNGHAYSPGTLKPTSDEFQRQIRPPEYLWCSRCGDVIWVGMPEDD